CYSVQRYLHSFPTRRSSDLVDFLGIRNTMVDVVYNGVGAHFYKKYDNDEKHEILSKYNLPKKYMLFLGNTDPKKNTQNVILAFADRKSTRLNSSHVKISYAV